MEDLQIDNETYIWLGNLDTYELQERLGIKLEWYEIEFLESKRQDKADVRGTENWHGFDIPLSIKCSSQKTFDEIVSIFQKYSDNINVNFQVFLTGNEKENDE